MLYIAAARDVSHLEGFYDDTIDTLGHSLRECAGLGKVAVWPLRGVINFASYGEGTGNRVKDLCAADPSLLPW